MVEEHEEIRQILSEIIGKLNRIEQNLKRIDRRFGCENGESVSEKYSYLDSSDAESPDTVNLSVE